MIVMVVVVLALNRHDGGRNSFLYQILSSYRSSCCGDRHGRHGGHGTVNSTLKRNNVRVVVNAVNRLYTGKSTLYALLSLTGTSLLVSVKAAFFNGGGCGGMLVAYIAAVS